MKTFKCKKRDEKDYQEYKADSMRIDDAGNLLFRASEDPDEVPRIIYGWKPSKFCKKSEDMSFFFLTTKTTDN